MKIPTIAANRFTFVLLAFLYCTLGTTSLFAEQLNVRVGVYDNPPKIFLDGTGKPGGFWGELTAAIAQEENWSLQFVSCRWSECLEFLESGKIDILPDVAKTHARSSMYRFNNFPISVSWSRAYVRNQENNIHSILDFQNKTIAVLANSVNYKDDEGIKEVLTSFNIDSRFLELDSYDEVFQAVRSGISDVAIVNKDFGESRKHQYGLKETSFIFQPLSLAFAFSPAGENSAQLIKKIDSRLNSWEASGNPTLQNLANKYLQPNQQDKDLKIPQWLINTLKFSLVIIILLLVVLFFFRLQLKKKHPGN